MKTKITALLLCLIMLSSLVLCGCADSGKPSATEDSVTETDAVTEDDGLLHPDLPDIKFNG